MPDPHFLRRDKLRDDGREDHSLPPQICEVPSFASSDAAPANPAVNPLLRSRQMSDVDRPSRGGASPPSNLGNGVRDPRLPSDGGLETLVSAFTPWEEMHSGYAGPWWAQDGHYMCISVREARCACWALAWCPGP